MQKRAVVLIVLFAVLAYGNSLKNGFVRDDQLLLVENNFYRSLKNIPRIFHPDYIVTGRQMILSPEPDLGSGVVSFRPVVSLSFFLDYQLWQDRSFGYHLHNLILHVANSVLAYAVLVTVLAQPSAALLGALLFAVHPIQSEAVNNIGFRSDLWAALFCFLSFRLFTRQKRWSSFLAYFLAVFSKESAIIVPVLMLLYDHYFSESNFCRRNFFNRHAGYWLITIFYLGIYWGVFGNSAVTAEDFFDGSLGIHLLTIIRIWGEYLAAFLWPPVIHALPILYRPSVDPVWNVGNVAAVMVAAGWFGGMVRAFRGSPQIFFCMSWMSLGFLPVANIIPLDNPMAYRFMYLPSLGFFGAAGMLMASFIRRGSPWKQFPTLPKIVTYSVLGFCVLSAIGLNPVWRSERTVALDVLKNFPDNAEGHFSLGREYVRLGLPAEAVPYLEKASELNPADPRTYYLLGLCFRADRPRMEHYLKKAIDIGPDYVLPYFVLGHEAFLAGDYSNAKMYLEKVLQLAPEFPGARLDLDAVRMKLEPQESAGDSP